MSDEQLVNLLKKGDESALQSIMLKYWEGMYKMAAHTLENSLSCEDIVQEIFIQIWNNRSNLKLRHSLKAYLFASTRYAIYREVRKDLRQKEEYKLQDISFVEYYNPQKNLEYNELIIHIEKTVESLPEQCQRIYRLSREEQLSHKEIASILKISTKTVENQITIALKKIKKAIKRNTLSISLFIISLFV
ncbi:sigma-70 family RNA polymerase sigma factor [Sphingobacterium sp. UT-1RO-CII-1]|uniref:RNA polymerase sigma factor n=1 Tax=Sphingobacterium sp. UT-1RO-CII-1 TaxID=2995225 RepID=UPI00227C9E22|nr:sigma-70 family RNA polymerase sigma factor [Sphingobacterium sp. UT-1RO-CII-1]MCY4778772.1 sigma-70 family RNA polymerase sigma factor [Sphingobacterium sp. UT-1RO-CII-1]